MYCNADVVLLDDPLSAVDAHVGKHIFNKLIREALHDKTVVLVTHQLNYVRDCDRVVFMKVSLAERRSVTSLHTLIFQDGEIVEQGTYDELMAANGECARLISSFAGSADGNQASLKSPVAPEEATDTDIAKHKGKAALATAEERITGAVSPDVYKAYIGAMGGSRVVVATIAMVILAQLTRVGNDLW